MTDWTPIPGWEGLYEAHPDGRIRSLDRIVNKGRWTQRHAGRELRPVRMGAYLAVTLYADGHKARRYVHHLIAETFIGSRPGCVETCHNDGDRYNNAAGNLRYDTASENRLDTVRHGHHNEASRSTCDKGHPFTPDNLGKRRNRRGTRFCLACRREAYATRKALAR